MKRVLIVALAVTSLSTASFAAGAGNDTLRGGEGTDRAADVNPLVNATQIRATKGGKNNRPIQPLNG